MTEKTVSYGGYPGILVDEHAGTVADLDPEDIANFLHAHPNLTVDDIRVTHETWAAPVPECDPDC